MSTLLSVLVFFVLFGALFGLPVAAAILFVRHREGRLQQVLREIKRQYKLRGRGRAQLVGRVSGRPMRITRDVRRGVVVSVDLLPADVRRRHAQWSRERAQAFTSTLRRLLTRSGAIQADYGDRVEGRWNVSLGAYPSTDAIEETLRSMREGLEHEKLLAGVAAAAHEAEEASAHTRLAEIADNESQPDWLREEAYRALLDGTDDVATIEGYATRLSASPHATLRKLSANAWDRIPGPEGSSPIRTLLGDNEPMVVETAARVLSARTKRNDADAEAVLLGRLKSETGPLLFAIVRALGSVGSARALAELGRWCDATKMTGTMKETVWRESTRIRAALGLTRGRDGGQLSMPPSGGELSPPKDPEPTS